MSSRSGLACAYDSVGRFGEAIDLFERVLGEREEVLGVEHPTTLFARSGLAYSYLYADQLAEAIDVCEGTLPDCQRVLGPEHLFTKQVKNILEMARREMNQSTASSE